MITALTLSLIINATLMLPLLPMQVMAGSPIAEVSYDGGETAGWPEFVGTVAGVVSNPPADERDSVVLLTGNYGEAGAIDHFGPAAGLPPAYSGHNAIALWGPPPDVPAAGVVVAVGLTRQVLTQFFDSVTEATRIDNTVDLDNDEQGRSVWVCRGQRTTWSQLWPLIARFGWQTIDTGRTPGKMVTHRSMLAQNAWVVASGD